MIHAHDGTTHRLVAILPETAGEGAEVFRARFEDRVRGFLTERGASVDPTTVTTRAVTFPGDEEGLAALRTEFQRIDALQHR